MPLRASKMNGFILGFHRRVWCPKWTPESNNSLMPILITIFLLLEAARFSSPPSRGTRDLFRCYYGRPPPLGDRIEAVLSLAEAKGRGIYRNNPHSPNVILRESG